MKAPPVDSAKLLSQNTPAGPGSLGCPCSGGRAISSAETGAAQVPVPLLRDGWGNKNGTARSFLLP